MKTLGNEISPLGSPRGALDLLVRAALAPPCEAREAWRTWRRGYDIDHTPWNEVRLLGAVTRRLDWLEPEAAIRPRIEGIRKFLWVKSHICLKEAIGAVAALSRAGIPILLMKGCARIANNPSVAQERLIRDVDLLVPLGRQDQAFETLEADGWSLVDNSWQARWRQTGTVAAHHAWSLSKGMSEIDLHHFSNHLNRLAGDDDGLWRRSQLLDWNNIKVHVPLPADSLIMALAHGIRWSQDLSADWTIDASAILDDQIVDWEIFLDDVQSRMLEAVAVSGLRYLRDALAKPVPDEVIEVLDRAVTADHEAELKYYVASALPANSLDARAAFAMAEKRVLARAKFERLSKPGPVSLQLIWKSSITAHPEKLDLWFPVPVKKLTTDLVTAQVELTSSNLRLGDQILGKFRIMGLPLCLTMAEIRTNPDRTKTALFQALFHKVFLELRQIQQLSFKYTLINASPEISRTARIRVTWYS
jgi:hypothetical protein